MAVLSFEAAGGRAQAQRERAWSADADKGRRPPHHPRTFRPFAAAMRRCKQGAMRKILKYAAIVLVLLLVAAGIAFYVMRSEEHTSELQSLMRISYAVFCLKQKKFNNMNYRDNIKITTK